jgi:hypothetical protein
MCNNFLFPLFNELNGEKKIVSNNLTNLTMDDDIVWGATAKLNLYDKLEHLAKKLNYVKRHV